MRTMSVRCHQTNDVHEQQHDTVITSTHIWMHTHEVHMMTTTLIYTLFTQAQLLSDCVCQYTACMCAIEYNA
jgi:hypothetical protein